MEIINADFDRMVVELPACSNICRKFRIKKTFNAALQHLCGHRESIYATLNDNGIHEITLIKDTEYKDISDMQPCIYNYRDTVYLIEMGQTVPVEIYNFEPYKVWGVHFSYCAETTFMRAPWHEFAVARTVHCSDKNVIKFISMIIKGVVPRNGKFKGKNWFYKISRGAQYRADIAVLRKAAIKHEDFVTSHILSFLIGDELSLQK